MMKLITLGATGGVIIFLTSLVIHEWLIPLVAPLSQESLEVDGVGLGAIAPGELRNVNLRLHNRSYRALRLMPPLTTCGCMSLEDGPIVIRPMGLRDVPVTFRAPDRPGEVRHFVTFRSEDGAGLEWKVPLFAEVVARIWAEPTFVQIEYDKEDKVETSIAIHHDPDVVIGTIVANSEIIGLTSRMVGNEFQMLDVTLLCPKSGTLLEGSCNVQVFDARDAKELLSVPISWRPCRDVRCVPEVLVLDSFGSTASGIERLVSVFARLGEHKQDLRVESLEPWVYVNHVERRGSGFVLGLTFDEAGMPDKIDAPILRLSVEGGRSPAYVQAKRQR